MEQTTIDLGYYLKVLNKILPNVYQLEESFDESKVVHYYNKMGKMYKKYHSNEGIMHFPIKTKEFERHNDKLLYQALSIAQLIKTHSCTKVIELGCGFGYNSIFLAKLFPDVQFIASDINEHNLHEARQRSAGLHNVTFIPLNFDDPFPDLHCDLVFGIETLCYAKSLNNLLKKIATILNSNGRVVIFDCYETNQSTYTNFNSNELSAYKLVCWGWALKKFPAIQELYSATQQHNLMVEYEANLTQNIISNYKVLQTTCKRIFKYPLALKILLRLKLLNRFVFMHIVNGLLGTYFLENQQLNYFHFIIKKNS